MKAVPLLPKNRKHKREKTLPQLSRRRLLAGGTSLAAAAVAPRIARAREAIDVGSVAALTGYLASYDANFLNGLKLAVKLINQNSGVDGHPLNLHILDGASSATTGATVANQLLNQYNVAVMLNGASSATTVAILPMCTDAKVPIITLSQLPPNAKWGFLSTTAFSRVTQLELQFTTQYLKAKTIGIIYNQTPAAQTATKHITDLAPKWGLQVVSTQGVDVNAIDFTPQLAALKSANPDAILDFMTGPAHILEAKAAATVDLKVPLVMGLDDTPTFQQASEAYPNAYLSAIPVQVYPDIADPGTKTAVSEFLDAYKKASLDLAGVQAAASGWDAAHMYAAAVKKGGATQGDALRNGIETLDYQGAVTHWHFTPQDHTGQEHSDALQAAKWENGALKVIFRASAK
jgi:branched-chain amino acid transport system substrate-binding protein